MWKRRISSFWRKLLLLCSVFLCSFISFLINWLLSCEHLIETAIFLLGILHVIPNLVGVMRKVLGVSEEWIKSCLLPVFPSYFVKHHKRDLCLPPEHFLFTSSSWGGEEERAQRRKWIGGKTHLALQHKYFRKYYKYYWKITQLPCTKIPQTITMAWFCLDCNAILA